MRLDLRHPVLLALLGFTLTAIPLLASAQTRTTAVAAAASYSGKTKLGALMDDPAAAAVLRMHAPEVMADKDIAKGRGYTLRFIAGFDKRLKAALPAIERDLAAIPVRAATR